MNGVYLNTKVLGILIKYFIYFIEASKTATSNIYRLVLEPEENDDSIRLDFRMLAEQAIPIELRQWVGNNLSY